MPRLMPAFQPRCVGVVRDWTQENKNPHPCSRQGTIAWNGRLYCKDHDPRTHPRQIEEYHLQTWEQLRDALRLLWAHLPKSTADSMFAEDLAQIDAALEAAKEE